MPHGRRVRRLQPAAAVRGCVAVVESRRRRRRTPTAVVLNSKKDRVYGTELQGDSGGPALGLGLLRFEENSSISCSR